MLQSWVMSLVDSLWLYDNDDKLVFSYFRRRYRFLPVICCIYGVWLPTPPLRGVGHLSFIFDFTEVVTLVGYRNKYPSTHSQLSILTLPKLLRSSGTEINIRPLTRNFQLSIINYQLSIQNILSLVLRPYGDEFASFDQLLQFGEGGVAATFADALEGGAAEAVVGGEVLLQALLDGGIGEVLVACGASAHDLG